MPARSPPVRLQASTLRTSTIGMLCHDLLCHSMASARQPQSAKMRCAGKKRRKKKLLNSTISALFPHFSSSLLFLTPYWPKARRPYPKSSAFSHGTARTGITELGAKTLELLFRVWSVIPIFSLLYVSAEG